MKKEYTAESNSRGACLQVTNVLCDSGGAIAISGHIRFLNLAGGDIDATYTRVVADSHEWRSEFFTPGFEEISGRSGEINWDHRSSPVKPFQAWKFEDAMSHLGCYEPSLPGVMESRDGQSKTAEKNAKYKLKSEQLNGYKVHVVETTRGEFTDKGYFDKESGMLRKFLDKAWTYEYLDYQPFAGKVFPRRVKISLGTIVVAEADITLDKIEKKAELFLPTPNADIVDYRCGIQHHKTAEVKPGKLLNRILPIYPAGSKFRHETGTVIIFAIIGKDGIVQSPLIVASPSHDLGAAAVAAVKQWRYEVFSVCGKATEVQTYVTVNFNMSG